MTETGWPLIPREVLPAPVPAVPAVRGAHRRPSAPHDPGRQLSIFGAETTAPSPADLVGLLAGPGRLGRMGGTARVSVRVDAAWRVHVLVAELVIRGLAVSWIPIEPPGTIDPSTRFGLPARPGPSTVAAETDMARETAGDSVQPQHEPGDDREFPRLLFEVRTAYSSRLDGLARAWPAAADALFLSGPGLRLWIAAAGTPRPGGYALGLDPGTTVLEIDEAGLGFDVQGKKEEVEDTNTGKTELIKDHEAIDAALTRAGLAGTVSDDGRWYVITGRRRLRRLAEMVGDRPVAAPEVFWPGGATA